MPACDHTGTPRIAFDGFLHFTSSTTSGSACLMRARTRASVSPRQSPSSLMRVSISLEGEVPSFAFFVAVFLMVTFVFVMVVPVSFFGRCVHSSAFKPFTRNLCAETTHFDGRSRYRSVFFRHLR